MAWFIGQSILMIAVAFLLGLLVGWIIWGRLLISRSTTTTSGAAAAAPASEAPSKEISSGAVDDGEPQPVAAIPEQRTSPEDSAEPEAEAAAHTAPETAGAVAIAEPEPEVEPTAEAEPAARAEPEPALSAAPETVATVAVAEPEPAVVKATPGKKRAKKAAAAAAPTAEEVESDDLERIEGIGPAMSRALAAAGIRTYAQLADAGEDVLRDAIQAQGLKFAPSLVTWSRQARLLAEGDEEGFADLTRRLVAGRDEGRE